MKKVLILFAFVFSAGMVSAQTCTKAEKAACAKSGKTCIKTGTASADGETKVASALSVAEIAAENDPTIERKVCEYSGNVSFYKKNVCEKSGKVSMTEVMFDEEASTFVNVSPKDMDEKEAKVVKTASESETVKTKACCKGKAKSCSKSKEGA
jgi:hypothetical protein